jgi:hypothetical protein
MRVDRRRPIYYICHGSCSKVQRAIRISARFLLTTNGRRAVMLTLPLQNLPFNLLPSSLMNPTKSRGTESVEVLLLGNA